MAAQRSKSDAEVTLREVTVTPPVAWPASVCAMYRRASVRLLVVMLKRDGQTIVPDGNTPIYAGDEAVIAALAS